MALKILEMIGTAILAVCIIATVIMAGIILFIGFVFVVASFAPGSGYDRDRDHKKAKKEKQEVADMLEKYVPEFDEEAFVQEYAAKQGLTRKQAIAELRRRIPNEAYYQDKIKRELKAKYPDAFVRKISQGAYSEGGTPDIMMIHKGHYFGFEIKRPVVGVPSKLQEIAVKQIREAGGSAAFVRWPEEAERIVEQWERGAEHEQEGES
nr:hypothetical protein [uncultured Dysosmobacter sp.]